MGQYVDKKPMSTSRGFSLVEVIIAVGLLGLIAAFTIPKVIQGTDKEKRAAVFRETITALKNTIQLAAASDSDPTSSNYTFFIDKINTVKDCSSACDTDGCLSTGPRVDESGFVMPNGSVVCGMNHDLYDADNMTIDWNGEAGPNEVGTDQLQVFLTFYLADGGEEPYGIYPGVASGGEVNATANNALWQDIFTR